jgi:hypothetical protein
VKTRSAGAGIGLHTKEDLEAFICGAIQVRSAKEVYFIPIALNPKRNAFLRLFLLPDSLMQDFYTPLDHENLGDYFWFTSSCKLTF